MDSLITILADAIKLGIEAKNASDAQAEAAALAALDAKLAEVHPTIAAMKDQIAKDRADVDEALRKKFHPDTPAAAKADVATDEQTKP